MAGENGPDGASVAHALLEAIRAAPGRFGFFQALRRIECAFRGKARLGEGRRPGDEPVRLSQAPSLAFSPTVLSKLEWDEGGPPRLVTQFFGLFGPQGPLPLHLTEYAHDRAHNAGDMAFVRFADMFHHRMMSLFYRAFASAEPTVSRDRPQSDRFAGYVASLTGIGLSAQRNRDALGDEVRLYYAGRFAAQPKNAEGLAAVISDFFRVPVEIEELVGEWIDVPERGRWRIGTMPLGRTMLGARAWIRQGKFRIVVGPMKKQDFERFLPRTKDHECLEAIVKSYVGEHLAWDLELRPEAEGREPWKLGASKLGWTTSLGEGRNGPASILVGAHRKSTEAGRSRAGAEA